MSRKIGVAIGILLLLVAGLAGYWWVQRERPADATLTLYGNVDIRELDLAFRQGGRVTSMTVDEGAAVKTGQLLAELDAAPLRDQLAAARAQVAAAKADLAKLEHGSRSQEIAQSQAAVRRAEAAERQAQRDFLRHARLQKTGAVSQMALDAARSARDQTRAALATARQGLSLAKEGARSEDIDAAKARVEVAEAALAQAQTALADARLVAPSDAVVSSRLREPGSMVAAGVPVYALSLQEPVYVRAYVSEPHLGQVAPGTAVTVRTDGNGPTFKGVIGFVSPRAEFTPKSVETTDLRTDLVYRLRVVIDAADAAKALRQGMPVTVDVTGTRDHDDKRV